MVSFLPDANFLNDSATIRRCIAVYSDFFADFQPDKARDMVGFFGLDESMALKNMSKGMREKAQIALAMSRDARVFLLDEPISGWIGGWAGVPGVVRQFPAITQRRDALVAVDPRDPVGAVCGLVQRGHLLFRGHRRQRPETG